MELKKKKKENNKVKEMRLKTKDQIKRRKTKGINNNRKTVAARVLVEEQYGKAAQLPFSLSKSVIAKSTNAHYVLFMILFLANVFVSFSPFFNLTYFLLWVLH